MFSVRSARRGALLLMLLITPFANLFAQRVASWEVCDTTHMQYLYDYGNLFSAASPADIASIGESMTGQFGHAVRHSTDSGRTWKELFFKEVFDDEWKSVIHKTAASYIIFGDSNGYLGDGGNTPQWRYQPFIMTSTDSGSAWSQVLLDTNSIVSDMAMLNDTYGVASVNHISNVQNALPSSLADDILVTNDGWKTWQTAHLPATIRSSGMLSCLRAGVFGLVGWSKKDTSYRYYKTFDTGKTWVGGGLLPWGIGQIVFVNERLGFAAGYDREWNGARGLITKTTDGGMSWVTIFDNKIAQSGYGGFSYIAFSDSLHGVATGDEIMQTEDGGDTWVLSVPPFGVSSNGATTVGTVIMPSANFALAQFGSTLIRYTGKNILEAPYFRPHDPGPIPIAPTTVAWTSVSGATKYELRLATDPPWPGSGDKYFYQPVLDTIVSDTTFILTQPKPAASYFGWLRSINGPDTSQWRQSGDWFQISDLFTTVIRPGFLLPPVILEPTDGELVTTPVRVTWNTVYDATSYEVGIVEGAGDYTYWTVTDTTISLPVAPSIYACYAKVRAHSAAETGDWSPERLFIFGQSDVSTSTTSINNSLPYPNPAREFIHIRLDEVPPTITMIDELGRETLVPTTAESGGVTVDVHAQRAGVYRVLAGGRMMRVVVQH